VLGRVSALVKKFVRTVALMRGLSESTANAAGGKIFTFGSYRLGVHGPGTDIDTLCVVPKHVSREDFFEVFEPMLRESEGVTEVSVRSTVVFESNTLIQIARVSQKHMCRLSKPRFLESHWTSLWQGWLSRQYQMTWN
jgi:poly(A) polymerase Pap1